MNKHLGWLYLNSYKNESFDFDRNNDGSWGYFDSDGSGSYYGTDGSWGYFNSDGSGSYYGADDSWGYRESDGSISFHGSDESWGYRESDGSGVYYDKHGNATYYDSSVDYDEDDYDYDDENVNDNDEKITVGEAILGAALLAGFAASSGKSQSERTQDELREIERQKKRQSKKEKRNAFYRKYWKQIVILFVAFCTLCFVGLKISIYVNSIPVGTSSNDFIGQDYKTVVDKLEKQGYRYVLTNEDYDLTVEDISKEGTVKKVSIDNNSHFSKRKRYREDANIVVVYHVLERISFPVSSKEAKKYNYKELVQKVSKAGFVNIRTEAVYDLITGWIHDQGDVESILVNGDDKYDENSYYRPDADILIKYHMFKEEL